MTATYTVAVATSWTTIVQATTIITGPRFVNIANGGLGSLVLNDGTTVCGVAFTAGGVNHVSNVLAEFCDVGFYLGSSDENNLVGCNSDFSMTNGYEMAAGGGRLLGCLSRGGSVDSTGTYDGFHTTGGAYELFGCLSYSYGSASYKYGFNDTTSHSPPASHYFACKSNGHTTSVYKTVDGNVGAAITLPMSNYIQVSGTTPSVDALANVHLNNGGGTVTNFTNGFGGQRLLVWGDGSTSIANNATIVTLAGSTLLLASNKAAEFVNVNAVWRQVS